jgi:hypothetical protein
MIRSLYNLTRAINNHIINIPSKQDFKLKGRNIVEKSLKKVKPIQVNLNYFWRLR